MNRQSLAINGELAKACENFTKELARLRNEHGFEQLKIIVTDSGVAEGKFEASIEVKMYAELEFDKSGALSDQWKIHEPGAPIASAQEP